MSKPDKAGQTCNKCFEHKPLTDAKASTHLQGVLERHAHMLARNPTTQVPCIIYWRLQRIT